MISFLTNKNSLGAEIRGRQIASFLGNTIIHIKPRDLTHVQDGEWVDISDGGHLPEMLKKRPKINVIAHSLHVYNNLDLPNKVVHISQQHLNWSNERRDRKEINTCGYIGALTDVSERIYTEIKEALKDWNFIFCHDYKTREDAIKFYKNIDVLVIGVWRGDGMYKTPTKMINAASFGVPSIADPLDGYEEWEGNYVRADSIEKMLEELEKFKDPQYYQEWSERIIKASEPYHISNVVEKYKQL